MFFQRPILVLTPTVGLAARVQVPHDRGNRAVVQGMLVYTYKFEVRLNMIIYDFTKIKFYKLQIWVTS